MRRALETPRGANGIFTCTIRMVTSCRLHIRSDELPRSKHPPLAVYLSLGSFLCWLVLSEFVWREFAALNVALIQISKVLPFLRQIVESENGRHGADGNTGPAVDALYGIDVELWNLVECRTTVIVCRVLLGVNAVNGAGIDASSVLGPDAGFGNNVCHGSPPWRLNTNLRPPDARFNPAAYRSTQGLLRVQKERSEERRVGK